MAFAAKGFISVQCISVLKFRSLKKDTFAPERVSFTTSGHGNGNGIQMPTSEIHKGSGKKLEQHKLLFTINQHYTNEDIMN